MRLSFFIGILANLALSAGHANELADPQSFVGISDTSARSAALFTELGKVLTHPRCVNCHPAGDRPLQGEISRSHQPPVERGTDGHGLPAMHCSMCHQQANFDPARVPGHPEWHLAPREMAWQNKTLGEICEQIKESARNGDRSLDDVVHHIGEDTLVGWGVGAGIWSSTCARHAEKSGGPRRGLGENRGRVSIVCA
jgi:hypothetical protein